MARKIFLSPSNQDKNTYSYGKTTEDVQCGKIARACETALKRCGFLVKLEQYDTMQNRVKHSNAWGADLHVPIHTNAFNEKVGGTRIFYYKANTSGHKAAQAVFDALKAMTPGKSDDCQMNKSLYELVKPKAPSVYVEAEFHDVPEYAKWIIEHTTEIGEAICKGICQYFGVAYKEEAKAEAAPEKVEVTYYVQTGAFNKKSLADDFKKKVKAAGFSADVVKASDGLYKVLVGDCDDKEEAKTLLAKLKKAGFDGFITAIKGEPVADEPEKKIVKGSKVRVKNGVRSYTGQKLASFVYKTTYTVIEEPKGDRVVIGLDGVVTAAVKASDLILV